MFNCFVFHLNVLHIFIQLCLLLFIININNNIIIIIVVVVVLISIIYKLHIDEILNAYSKYDRRKREELLY